MREMKWNIDYLKVGASERLKGLLVSAASDHDGVTAGQNLKNLEKSGVPVVLIDRNLEGKQFDGIFVKNFEGAYDGVQALINEGHKKIAIITGAREFTSRQRTSQRIYKSNGR